MLEKNSMGCNNDKTWQEWNLSWSVSQDEGGKFEGDFFEGDVTDDDEPGNFVLTKISTLVRFSKGILSEIRQGQQHHRILQFRTFLPSSPWIVSKAEGKQLVLHHIECGFKFLLMLQFTGSSDLLRKFTRQKKNVLGQSTAHSKATY